MNYEEYREEVIRLMMHCYLYYEADSPIIPDFEYDKRYAAIQKFEYNQERKLPCTPTEMIGFDLDKFKQAVNLLEEMRIR